VIYLDHNATTPLLPEVTEAMLPFFHEKWGNPSSTYRFGSNLRSALEHSRESVALLIGAYAPEVIFTGCATESNNAAIHAAIRSYPTRRRIVTSAVEHSSILNYCKVLESEGYSVVYLPVDQSGQLDLADLREAVSSDTAIVSIMWANNETGVIFPIQEISEFCKQQGVLFHTDAVQVAGKMSIDVSSIHVDYLSLAGHKINGPKGVGALYINRKAPFKPYLYGGHQERGWRGGTSNVPLIVGMGKASEVAAKKALHFHSVVSPLRDELEDGIVAALNGVVINGEHAPRLANTSNLSISGVPSEALLLMLDQEGLCASSGSACLAESDVPSHVIEAMKPTQKAASEAVRLSLSHDTTRKEILDAVRIISSSVKAIRGIGTKGAPN